jgi:hypothetical protein
MKLVQHEHAVIAEGKIADGKLRHDGRPLG